MIKVLVLTDPLASIASVHPMPKVLVISVNYNGRHLLDELFGSLFKQTRPADEVIMVDNASIDGSAEYVRKYFPQVKIIQQQRNKGFAQGINIGVASKQRDYSAASSPDLLMDEILVFINPDTSVQPDWLHHLLLPFSNPLVGLTTSKILLMSDPETINTCGNEVHLTGLTLCRGLGRPKNYYNETNEVQAVSGAAFAIRRALFDRLGGLDEDFFMYMEDTDLSLRARLNGWKCVYVPQSIVFHDYRLRFGPNKVLYQERNRYATLLKSLKWKTLIVLLPALVLAEVLTWGFVAFCDRPNWRNKLRAYRSIIVTWKEIMRKRKATQQLRTISDRELIRDAGFALDWGQFGKGWLTNLARGLFIPPFFILKKLMLILVWW